MDAMTEMERALGAEAVGSLKQRRLLWDVGVPTATDLDAAVRLDRTLGVVLGLAAGNTDDSGRVGVETQTFVLAAEAWLDHGWRAPEALAEQLLARAAHACGPRRRHRRGGRRAPQRRRRGTSPPRRRTATPPSAAPRPSAPPSPASRQRSAWRRRLDAAVTHAERHATAASAALAAIVAGLIRRDPATTPVEVCRSGRRVRAPTTGVRDLLVRALSSLDRRRRHDPAAALGRPRRRDAGARRVVRTRQRRSRRSGRRGSGPRARFARRRRDHRRSRRRHPRRRRPARSAGTPTSRAPPPTRASPGGSPPRRSSTPTGDEQRADIWFLLDRSGSMQSIARDVVTGFDGFFAEPAGDRRRGDRDGRAVRRRRPPRGARRRPAARRRALDRRPLRAPRHDAAVRRHRAAARPRRAPRRRRRRPARRRLHRRPRERQPRLDPAAAVRPHRRAARPRLDVRVPRRQPGQLRRRRRRRRPRRQHQQLHAEPDGVQAAYTGLDRTVSDWRGKSRQPRRRDTDDFWGGRKEAEEQG